MRSIKPVQKVIDSFESLPGIGPKSAARLAYYLLFVPQERLIKFARNLERLRLDSKFCKICGNVGEAELCLICMDKKRDNSIICVVEQPLDLLAIEASGSYGGVYHVLGGVINPLSNVGPDDLRLDLLWEKLGKEGVDELILATNPSMEGEATAMYIDHYIRDNLKIDAEKLRITRIGRGLPTGADLEYADTQTLTRAMEGRREMK